MVQVKIKVKGKKVSLECSCGMASEGHSQRPSCVQDVPVNWLSNFYFVDYPLLEYPHLLTWTVKGIGKVGFRYFVLYVWKEQIHCILSELAQHLTPF